MILNVENKAKLVKLGPVWVTYLKQCMTISSLSSPRSRKLGHPLTLSFLPELFVPPHCQSPPVCCCFCLWGYQTDSLEEALGLGSARRRGDQSAILRNNGTELFLRHLLTRRSRDVEKSKGIWRDRRGPHTRLEQAMRQESSCTIFAQQAFSLFCGNWPF